MIGVDIDAAAKDLVNWIARADAGEEVVLLRLGKPVARLLPVESPRQAGRGFGAWKGRFAIPDSFFDPLPEEELKAWEGGCPSPS